MTARMAAGSVVLAAFVLAAFVLAACGSPRPSTPALPSAAATASAGAAPSASASSASREPSGPDGADSGVAAVPPPLAAPRVAPVSPAGPGATWAVALTLGIAGGEPGTCNELVCPSPGNTMGAPACREESVPCGVRATVEIHATVTTSRFAREPIEPPTRRLLKAFAECLVRVGKRTTHATTVVDAEIDASGRIAKGTVGENPSLKDEPIILTCMRDALTRGGPYPASDNQGFTLRLRGDMRIIVPRTNVGIGL